MRGDRWLAFIAAGLVLGAAAGAHVGFFRPAPPPSQAATVAETHAPAADRPASRRPPPRRALAAPLMAQRDFELLMARLEVSARDWSDGEVNALLELAAAGVDQAYVVLVEHCPEFGACETVRAALEDSAARGRAESAFLLAELHGDERYAHANETLRIGWLLRYGELGDPAQRLYAAEALLLDAAGRPELRDRAVRWVAEAADVGEPEAVMTLLAHREGWRRDLGVGPDRAEADRLLATLVESGDAFSLRAAAAAYGRERATPEDVGRAAVAWEAAGAAGDPEGDNNAAWLLALCDGSRAAVLRAIALIDRQHAAYGETAWSVDTLAMVQAAAGLMGDAVQSQARALERLRAEDPASPWLPEFEARLALYARGASYRDPATCGATDARPAPALAERRPTFAAQRLATGRVED